jgi:cytochrome c biogenesis protein CcdA
MLLLFGILMLWPRSFAWLSAKTGGLMKVRSSLTPPIRVDSLGGFVLGATLGLVWTPCAGPVLGSILTLMAMTPDLGWAAVLLTFYAAGAAIPMLAIAYGGQAATTRVRAIAPLTPRLQQGFGLVVIGVAVAMFFHYDLTITLWLSDLYPNGQTGL